MGREASADVQAPGQPLRGAAEARATALAVGGVATVSTRDDSDAPPAEGAEPQSPTASEVPPAGG
eukprot:4005171-Prymnesium_polylepis.1